MDSLKDKNINVFIPPTESGTRRAQLVMLMDKGPKMVGFTTMLQKNHFGETSSEQFNIKQPFFS